MINRPVAPPPPVSAARQLLHNLFGSPIDAAITLALTILGVYVGWIFIDWAILNATWVGTRASDCAAREGACWAFIGARWGQIIYGPYPVGERWRVNICFAVGLLCLTVLLLPRWARRDSLSAGIVVAYPLLCWVLLRGGLLGIAPVATDQWGGLMLTLVVAVTAIMSSILLGLTLALGRRSRFSVVSTICAAFIEFWRGVPLLAVLFIASVMFPLFVPSGFEVNLLVRVLIAFSVFKAAYVAEAFRGGLQIVPKGQIEAAQALGLSRWRSLRTIILPQVFRHVRPALINIYILTFKETTVVVVIGLADLTGVIQLGLSDSNWLGGGNIAASGYVFIAITFWCITFAISRWGAYLEHRDNQITHRSLQKG